MPRNMSLAAAASNASQATYGNICSKGSSQQQQRSVSPDLVSKRQLKEQMGQFELHFQ